MKAPLIFNGAFLSHVSDSNQRPTHYECVALPTELKWLFLDVQRYNFF